MASKHPPLVDVNLGPDERLQEYMRLHRQLTMKRIEVKKKLAPIFEELREINSKISRVGTAIFQLKHGGETPLVTDHAIVRYLERVEGVDIDSIRLKVISHARAVRQGNVYVTVNDDLEEDLDP